MKKLIFTLIFIVVAVVSISAQMTFTVSGNVTSSNTSLTVPNHTVNISVFDSASSFTFQATTLTNSNGFYSFTVSGNVVMPIISVYTLNCQNQNVYQYIWAAPYTANFNICTSVINPPCASNFNSIQDSVNPNKFYFFNASTGNPTTYLWNFGDNTTSSVQNPNHTYNSTGYFMVSLTISGNGCQSVSYDTIYVGSAQPCQAAFSQQITGNTVQFYNSSTGNPTSYLWSFGDGTSSNLLNPNHTYAAAGTYTVTLTIFGSNCQNSVTQTIVIAGALTYSLAGYITAGNNPLDYGTVMLFNLTNPWLTTTTLDSMGHYYFGNLAAANYYVYAAPDVNSQYAPFYMGTYYQNALTWAGATTITLNSNQYSKNISLTPVIPSNGGGAVNGNVLPGAKGSVSNLSVNLYNTSNNPIRSTKTNTNGQYSFTNLAFGEYKIQIEVPGKTSDFIPVTLNAQNPTSSSNNFVSGSNGFTSTVGIEENNNELISNVYPNPVSNYFNLEYTLAARSDVKIQLYNAFGQLIMEENGTHESGIQKQTINTSELPSGTFMLRVSTSTGESFHKMMIKM